MTVTPKFFVSRAVQIKSSTGTVEKNCRIVRLLLQLDSNCNVQNLRRENQHSGCLKREIQEIIW